ncbi:tubulin-like doman-containing protein [Nocardiopsis sp. NPDC049922]|uniref:tubulin-like doman-containing protein n=1 Tax=Nocardiopsis sp. NPDC049922 TaxID=3155157 RepID=UPI0033C77A63
MTMKLYQPMLYVGLGGTGCLIGAELERRLRDELCGPDGTEFQQRRPGGNLLPYQLPSCVQFVYADVNHSELDRIPEKVVPGSQHLQAVEATAHYVHDLVPSAHTYPEVARSLRLSAGETVAPWLPPADGEPRVAPLSKGAGQFPTVGRAALFETFRGGTRHAVAAIGEAINRLATSAGDLNVLGGGLPRSCDVFVAFSVAGGTGAGIYYDYLHLIADTFARSDLHVKIYPLILMPSAFDEGMGGGRHARLNAGRALLDIFRLVDHQNGGTVGRTITTDTRPSSRTRDEVHVHYPVEGRVRIRPSTVETAFLFSRPVGARREDLHRSVVSLVLSLAGTVMEHRGDTAGSAETHQSFADSFINGAAFRHERAESGIGNRGVSTALVASMTVPVDELSDIIASRLLRAAVQDMRAPTHDVEGDRHLIESFFSAANIHPLLIRPAGNFSDPGPATGAKDIGHSLFDRLDSMQRSLAARRTRLAREVTELAQNLDHRAGIRALLTAVDPFHARRVVVGQPGTANEVVRLGVFGLLNNRRNGPPPPDGVTQVPPTVPPLADRMGGLVKAKYNDPLPVQARADQDRWFEWQNQVLWHEAWANNAPRWTRATTRLSGDLTALTEALEGHAQRDPQYFERKAQQLYQRRTGVSYLLPPVGGNLEPFYRRVRDRLAAARQEEGVLPANAGDAELVRVLVGAEAWRTAYDISVDRSPEEAVGHLRETLKSAVKQFLRDPGPTQQPLLPRLADLLSRAAQQGDAPVAEEDLAQFRAQLAGLLPAGFVPQGGGPLRVLITYHAPGRNGQIENHLMESLALPRGPGITYELRAVSAESLSVVLFRTSMSVTEVQEVRDVLRNWSDAVYHPQPGDHLRWRQRLGYDFDYLATTEEHRVYILHRLLNAMWNGRASVVGDPRSPEEVHFTLGGGVTMQLRLTPLEEASSWGSLLRAYELWAFNGEDAITRQFCAQLMNELPTGVEGRPEDPHEVYQVLRETTDAEAKRLDALVQELHSSHRGRVRQYREFWADLLPAALAMEFHGTAAPLRANLAALEQAVARRNEGR